MSYDISNIKKLPVEERIKIIDAIWESCIQDDASLTGEDDILSVVEERVEKYESGRMKTLSWDEFIQKLKNRQDDLDN